jgi:hypothetical protein
MTRSEVQFLYEHLTRCARPPRSGNETLEDNQKFKYAVGRNYQITARIVDETERMKAAIKIEQPTPPDGYAEYERARQDIILKHAKRNDGGQVVAKRDEQTGEANPVIPPEAHTQVMREVDALQVQYKDILAARQAQVQAMEDQCAALSAAIDNQMVEFALFAWPFEKVPEAISGTHLADLSPMLTGCPELEPGESNIVELRPAKESS